MMLTCSGIILSLLASGGTTLASTSTLSGIVSPAGTPSGGGTSVDRPKCATDWFYFFLPSDSWPAGYAFFWPTNTWYLDSTYLVPQFDVTLGRLVRVDINYQRDTFWRTRGWGFPTLAGETFGVHAYTTLNVRLSQSPSSQTLASYAGIGDHTSYLNSGIDECSPNVMMLHDLIYVPISHVAFAHESYIYNLLSGSPTTYVLWTIREGLNFGSTDASGAAFAALCWAGLDGTSGFLRMRYVYEPW